MGPIFAPFFHPSSSRLGTACHTVSSPPSLFRLLNILGLSQTYPTRIGVTPVGWQFLWHYSHHPCKLLYSYQYKGHSTDQTSLKTSPRSFESLTTGWPKNHSEFCMAQRTSQLALKVFSAQLQVSDQSNSKSPCLGLIFGGPRAGAPGCYTSPFDHTSQLHFYQRLPEQIGTPISAPSVSDYFNLSEKVVVASSGDRGSRAAPLVVADQ